MLFALAMIAAHVPRYARIDDAYASADMVFSHPPIRLADVVRWTPATATGLWLAGLVGALLLLWGGRLAKPGLALFVATSFLLLEAEAFNIKAYDRLSLWIAVGLLLSPVGERGLLHKERSPFARWWLLITFSFLYFSTGAWKAAQPGGEWFVGDVLAWHLVDHWFGGRPLGVWVSGRPWLILPMQWFTLAFELAFPLLVLWRRSNPWILAMGAAMHLGIQALMNVGPFSLVALSAYPVLLHPEVARGGWRRVSRRSCAASRPDPR